MGFRFGKANKVRTAVKKNKIKKSENVDYCIIYEYWSYAIGFWLSTTANAHE